MRFTAAVFALCFFFPEARAQDAVDTQRRAVTLFSGSYVGAPVAVRLTSTKAFVATHSVDIATTNIAIATTQGDLYELERDGNNWRQLSKRTCGGTSALGGFISTDPNWIGATEGLCSGDYAHVNATSYAISGAAAATVHLYAAARLTSDGPLRVDVKRISPPYQSIATAYAPLLGAPQVAANSRAAFWVATDGIHVHPDIGVASRVIPARFEHVTKILADASNVYVATSTTISKVVVASGTVTTLVAHACTDFDIDETYVYCSRAEAGEISKTPITGGQAAVIVSGQIKPTSISVDATSIAYVDRADYSVKLLTPK